mgnify:CR=1 FL=1
MTPELQEYYDSQWTMFASKGWQDLIEDLETLEEGVENLRTVTNNDELNFRKGQLDILRLIMERKATCEKTFEDLHDE